MGHRANAYGLRLGGATEWPIKSNLQLNYVDEIHSDLKVQEYLKNFFLSFLKYIDFHVKFRKNQYSRGIFLESNPILRKLITGRKVKKLDTLEILYSHSEINKTATHYEIKIYVFDGKADQLFGLERDPLGFISKKNVKQSGASAKYKQELIRQEVQSLRKAASAFSHYKSQLVKKKGVAQTLRFATLKLRFLEMQSQRGDPTLRLKQRHVESQIKKLKIKRDLRIRVPRGSTLRKSKTVSTFFLKRDMQNAPLKGKFLRLYHRLLNALSIYRRAKFLYQKYFAQYKIASQHVSQSHFNKIKLKKIKRLLKISSQFLKNYWYGPRGFLGDTLSSKTLKSSKRQLENQKFISFVEQKIKYEWIPLFLKRELTPLLNRNIDIKIYGISKETPTVELLGNYMVARLADRYSIKEVINEVVKGMKDLIELEINQRGSLVLNPNKNRNILGFRLKCAGRFTREERSTSVDYIVGEMPLGHMSKAIEYVAVPTILKYGVGGMKLWLYKAPEINKYETILASHDKLWSLFFKHLDLYREQLSEDKHHGLKGYIPPKSIF